MVAEVVDQYGTAAGSPSSSTQARTPPFHVIRLFVTGMSRASTTAIALVKEVCDERLAGNYELEVIDIYQSPARAREAGVVAAPTLIKRWPLPIRRMVGNLSSRDRVLQALDLEEWT